MTGAKRDDHARSIGGSCVHMHGAAGEDEEQEVRKHAVRREKKNKEKKIEKKKKKKEKRILYIIFSTNEKNRFVKQFIIYGHMKLWVVLSIENLFIVYY